MYPYDVDCLPHEEDIFEEDYVNKTKGMYEFRFSKRLWTTSDGSTIHLQNMTVSHLTNSINHIKNKGPGCVYGYGYRWLPVLEEELCKRKETI